MWPARASKAHDCLNPILPIHTRSVAAAWKPLHTLSHQMRFSAQRLRLRLEKRLESQLGQRLDWLTDFLSKGGSNSPEKEPCNHNSIWSVWKDKMVQLFIFYLGQTLKSRKFCVWWFTTALGGNLMGASNQLKSEQQSHECSHCSRLRLVSARAM